MLSTYFRINQPSVVYETFEDEVVAINFGTGNYYSLQRVAYDIWSLIEQGNNAEGIIKRIILKYDGEPQKIEEAIETFLQELQQEGLVVEAHLDNSTLPKVEDRQDGSEKKLSRFPFIAPSLQKYNDMQQMLLLDPIHEIDKMGWPKLSHNPPSNQT